MSRKSVKNDAARCALSDPDVAYGQKVKVTSRVTILAPDRARKERFP